MLGYKTMFHDRLEAVTKAKPTMNGKWPHPLVNEIKVFPYTESIRETNVQNTAITGLFFLRRKNNSTDFSEGRRRKFWIVKCKDPILKQIEPGLRADKVVKAPRLPRCQRKSNSHPRVPWSITFHIFLHKRL